MAPTQGTLTAFGCYPDKLRHAAGPASPSSKVAPFKVSRKRDGVEPLLALCAYRLINSELSQALQGGPHVAPHWLLPCDPERLIDYDGRHALAFPCRFVDGCWIEVRTGRIIDVHPTHWRAVVLRSPSRMGQGNQRRSLTCRSVQLSVYRGKHRAKGHNKRR
jgi:hypothetical protein